MSDIPGRTSTTITTTTSTLLHGASSSNGTHSLAGVGGTNGIIKENGLLPAPASSSSASSSSSSSAAVAGPDVWADGIPRSFRRSDYVRLLMQALVSLGYTTSAGMLESEAGIKLHADCVAEFRQAILDGHWSMATTLLGKMDLPNGQKRKNVEFLIVREQFLELVERAEVAEALVCLRSRIAPLSQPPEVIHKLSSLLVCSSPAQLRQAAQWDGAGHTSRVKLLSQLQGLISPSLLIPERRLEVMLDQSLRLQAQLAHYHAPPSEPLPLFSDLSAEIVVPQHTYDMLEGHTDEVWFVQWSNSGHRIATASKDTTMIIWNLHTRGAIRCAGHLDAVTFLSWNPQDTHILTCSNDTTLKLWDAQTGVCLHTYTHHSAPTACAWLPDGVCFVSGGTDKRLDMYSTQTHAHMHSWPDIRVNDLAISRDGKVMVVCCTEKKIHVFDLGVGVGLGGGRSVVVEECDNLRSLHLSPDGRYVLVNVSTQEVHLWDLEERVLLQTFKGYVQQHFVIRSTFGGVRGDFVASGSEDSQVYLWHRQTGKLLATLPGHAGTINAVAWAPADPYRFASASDDNTVRLWSATSSQQDSHASWAFAS